MPVKEVVERERAHPLDRRRLQVVAQRREVRRLPREQAALGTPPAREGSTVSVAADGSSCRSAAR